VTRRYGVLVVLGLWGIIGYFALCAIWPLIFVPIAMVALFVFMLYCALFVWPNQGEL
jgi:hypothetical protein